MVQMRRAGSATESLDDGAQKLTHGRTDGGMRYTEADPERQRLRRRHRNLVRWDEVIEEHVVSNTREQIPWQSTTDDRTR